LNLVVLRPWNKKKVIIREVAVGKVAARFCRTLIVKELEINVEHGRVLTT
jgi:hypothetical protein